MSTASGTGRPREEEDAPPEDAPLAGLRRRLPAADARLTAAGR